MISIITPTYNSGKYLEECILSIKSQKYKNYEHIIVDGGSTDNTLDIIKKYEGTYPMKWISEPDNGMYDAISKGFEMSRGEIMSWLNSDDIYMPWTLQVVAEIFQKTDVNWLTGVPSHIDAVGRQYFSTMKPILYPQKLVKLGWMDGRKLGCIQQESTFWNRSLYNRVLGLNTNFKLAGDYMLWKKFAKFEKLYSINSMLASFRIHGDQKSNDKNAYWKEIGQLSLVEKVLCKMKIYRIINIIAKRNSKLLLDINITSREMT